MFDKSIELFHLANDWAWKIGIGPFLFPALCTGLIGVAVQFIPNEQPTQSHQVIIK